MISRLIRDVSIHQWQGPAKRFQFPFVRRCRCTGTTPTVNENIAVVACSVAATCTFPIALDFQLTRSTSQDVSKATLTSSILRVGPNVSAGSVARSVAQLTATKTTVTVTLYTYVSRRSNNKQESRAIAGRTARYHCKFRYRYVSNFTISR